jgi:hypothetical protein
MNKRKLLIWVWVSLAGNLAYAQVPDLPKRKAGLWEMKMEMSSTPGRVMISEQCIDEKTDAQLQNQALAIKDQLGCSRQNRKTLHGYEIDSTCKMDGRTVVSHAVLSGDFSRAYTLESHATYTPPIGKLSAATVKVTTRYLGACKAGMQPGDIRMNGVKVASVGGASSADKMTPEQARQVAEEIKKAH